MDKITEKIIMELVKAPPNSTEDVNIIKRFILRSNKTNHIPNSAELLKAYHKLVKKNKIKKNVQIEKMLIKRGVRTLSGVAIITALTKPFPCPGQCIYCPDEAKMPKSYISDEPAAARALTLKFNPFQQVKQRIKMLENNGHPTDKLELIVKGGTWNSYPLNYQYWFISECFRACNKKRTKKISKNEKTLLIDLIKQQKINETAVHRIIGLTLETRPDFINKKTIEEMRNMGCTRIEMGVQTVDEKILKIIKRGHGIEAVKEATKILKNYGFKVDYHLMPQLPKSTPKKDLEMLLEIFKNNNYRPDMIKIYPCTVIDNSELYEWVKKGKFKPYSTKALVKILKEFKTKIPRYVRISRLIRDIPGNHILAGNTITNLRQIIQSEMKKDGLKCKCLRCREVGHNLDLLKNNSDKTKLFIDKYKANNGTEYFLSFEDNKRKYVFAFCRFRIDKNGLYPAFIRELHTYGQALEVNKKENEASQHKGMGKKLTKEVEKICKKNKIKKLAVISGVGVRGYYRKLGYKLENGYMTKNIK